MPMYHAGDCFAVTFCNGTGRDCPPVLVLHDNTTCGSKEPARNPFLCRDGGIVSPVVIGLVSECRVSIVCVRTAFV